MDISSIATTSNTSSLTDQGKRKATLTQADFMNLLVNQMKYQNPLEPMDSSQMASQVTQFGSLEALNGIQQGIQNLVNTQASQRNLEAAGLIGKKIETKGNVLSVSGGSAAEGYYQLQKTGIVGIQIFDAQGNLVRTLQTGVKEASKQKIEWDGKNQQGFKVPDGLYSFRVSAADEKGQTLSVDTFRVATVTGISFENGTTYYQLGNEKITFSDIAAIRA